MHDHRLSLGMLHWASLTYTTQHRCRVKVLSPPPPIRRSHILNATATRLTLLAVVPVVRVRMHGRRDDVVAQMGLVLAVDAEAAVAVGTGLVEAVRLAHEAAHQHGPAQRQFVASVHLPEMPSLAIELHGLFHLLGLGRVPDGIGHGGRGRRRRRLGHDELAALDLEYVRVPQLPLGRVQPLVQLARDHVLHPNQARIRRWRIEYYALPITLCVRRHTHIRGEEEGRGTGRRRLRAYSSAVLRRTAKGRQRRCGMRLGMRTRF